MKNFRDLYKNSNYDLLSEFKDWNTPVLIRCNTCGKIYLCNPKNLVLCCDIHILSPNYTLWQKFCMDIEHLQSFYRKVDDRYILLTPYDNEDDEILVKCNTCNTIIRTTISEFFSTNRIIRAYNRCPNKCNLNRRESYRDKIYNTTTNFHKYLDARYNKTAFQCIRIHTEKVTSSNRKVKRYLVPNSLLEINKNELKNFLELILKNYFECLTVENYNKDWIKELYDKNYTNFMYSLMNNDNVTTPYQMIQNHLYQWGVYVEKGMISTYVPVGLNIFAYKYTPSLEPFTTGDDYNIIKASKFVIVKHNKCGNCFPINRKYLVNTNLKIFPDDKDGDMCCPYCKNKIIWKRYFDSRPTLISKKKIPKKDIDKTLHKYKLSEYISALDEKYFSSDDRLTYYNEYIKDYSFNSNNHCPNIKEAQFQKIISEILVRQHDIGITSYDEILFKEKFYHANIYTILNTPNILDILNSIELFSDEREDSYVDFDSDISEGMSSVMDAYINTIDDIDFDDYCY